MTRPTNPRDDAALLLARCAQHGWTLAVAESLTGGALTSTIVGIPGASAVLRAGIVAYATDLKAALLEVPQAVLDEHGPVARETAAAMAQGVRSATGADVGIATTGVAGPDPQDGHPPGTVFVAVATPHGTVTQALELAGDRAAVRSATVAAALRLALRRAVHEE